MSLTAYNPFHEFTATGLSLSQNDPVEGEVGGALFGATAPVRRGGGGTGEDDING